MHILFTIGRYWPAVGGAESLVREVAWRLAASNEVSVASLVNNNDPDFLGRLREQPRPSAYLDGQVDARLLHASGPRRLFLEAYIQLACRSCLPKIQQALFKIAYGAELEELISRAQLVHTLPAMSMSLVRLTAKIACSQGVPFVITPHLHGEEEASAMCDVLLQADGVIALTTVERDWIASVGVPENRIEVTGIGHTIAPSQGANRFRARHKIDGPIVLFIGRKETYKGYRQMLAAAPDVWRKQPHASFVFIGPPTLESQRDFMGWRGERRILELPTINVQEKSEALADCDLLCVPSTKESFGHIFLEAWGAGKPVIAADIPVERAVIEEGEDGLLTAQEPSDIAETVLHLLGDPQKAREMGAKGRLKVLEKYN
ncbi:MAG: glycosyltransferase, partial [Armatimonadetes bacterium]|nr:glycosyltransferase [Armatimonadota bacterium]NIO76207.1 glycosyltransferase [Armatimonadota bacterium]NIO98873.1 glycosyltransferase [Armatimonadota bacterium]